MAALDEFTVPLTGIAPPLGASGTNGAAGGGNAGGHQLRVVTVGHVDHGKSTLIGRIFHDTDTLPEGKIEQIRKACLAEGMEFEYAFLLDALLEEQEQNITIDTTQLPFRTAKRGYVLVDAPGHKEFLKNMVTGAASADAALLIIAASEGVREQSRRHGYLLSLLGVKQILVVVNKMDLVDYSESAFQAIVDEYTEFLREIGLEARLFLPVSARNGVNVTRRPSAEMPWYVGPTVLGALDELEAPKSLAALPLRMPLQDVYRFDARRIFAGRIESGTLRVGDDLVFAPTGKTGVVKTLERWHGPIRDFAVAGESVGITLEDQIFVARGAVAAPVGLPPATTSRFRARLFWMGQNDLIAGERYKLKLATQEAMATVVEIERVIDASTLSVATEGRTHVARNDVAEIVFQTDVPLALDAHDVVALTGRFVLVDNRITAGGGIVLEPNVPEPQRPTIRSLHITQTAGKITTDDRAQRNGHRGAVVWLTGLSGSGKSTLAHVIERELFERGMQSYVLDGDNLRFGLNANLGFSPEDREENIRRVAEVARLFADSGQIVLASLISPYRQSRAHARDIAERAGVPFVEVYVKAPLDTCEARDPKGLYRRARAGEIPGFTGIDAPYEEPERAEVVVDTATLSIEEAAVAVLEAVLERASQR
jgi:bifunctional enzyme CysN/CysC